MCLRQVLTQFTPVLTEAVGAVKGVIMSSDVRGDAKNVKSKGKRKAAVTASLVVPTTT